MFNLSLIPKIFYKEIFSRNFNNYYLECSGGYHSTYTILHFYKNNIKNCFLFHNETYLEYSECKENISKLIKMTKYPIIITKPNFKKYINMNNLMKISFSNINKAKEVIKKGKHNYRDFFPCCKVLKKYPSIKWIKENILPNSIIISSLTPYESFNRQMRLYELKKKNTYIRFHKTKNSYVGYPFRDLLYGNRNNTRKIVEPLFENYLGLYKMNIKHSGCKFCPIRILNPKMLTINDCSIKYNKIFNKNYDVSK